jgi:hypothetical protein
MNLFKFTTASIAQDILTSLSIRFTPPGEFNDIFEVSPYIDLFTSGTLLDLSLKGLQSEHGQAEYLASIKTSYDGLASEVKALMTFGQYLSFVADILKLPDVQETMRILFRGLPKLMSDLINPAIKNGVNDALGFLCLGGHPFSELMWAHYADSHKGVALIFFESHDFFQQADHPGRELRKPRKVVYSDTRPVFDDLLAMQMTEELNTKLQESIFFTKSSAWSYEAEIRCIRSLHEADFTKVLPTGATGHFFTFPADALQGIVFGSRCSEADKKRLYELMLGINDQHKTNLLAGSMVAHDKKYALSIEPYPSAKRPMKFEDYFTK